MPRRRICVDFRTLNEVRVVEKALRKMRASCLQTHLALHATQEERDEAEADMTTIDQILMNLE